MKQLSAIRLAAATAALGIYATAQAAYEIPNPAYNAPASFYNAATGTGATLKTNLRTIISSMTGRNYGDARYWAAITDVDPNNASNVILMYNRASVTAAWDGGITWNREHIWPQSLMGLDVDNSYVGMGSDEFELRPANPSINSSRGNDPYGTVNSTGSNANNGAYYFPGDSDKGDGARALFYMATRYSNLTLVTSSSPAVMQMGDLASLLKYHYTDGVDNFERRRNQYIYSSALNPTYYQGNRNPFVDHPEYVWAIFGLDSGQGANSSKLYVGGSAPADGISSSTSNLRVMKNGTFGTTSVVLNKSGVTPTTYDVTTSGSATTTASGVGQTFDYNTQARTLTVGLSASTATTGLKTGSVIINNTDLTSLGGGQGSADGDDTVTINGAVLDNRVVTATAYSGRVIRSSSIPVTLSTTGDDNSFTRVTVTGAGSATVNNAAIAAGSSQLFNGPATLTNARSITANFPTTGAKSGTLNFTVAGEGLAGESVQPVAVTYNVTAVDHSEGSFVGGANTDAASVDFDYVPQGFTRSQSVSIHNRQAVGGANALMDIDSVNVSGDGVRFSTGIVPTGVTPIAGGASNSYNVALDTSAVGDFAATHTINVSDEDIPGATAGTPLALATTGKVTAGVFPTSGTLMLGPGETWSPAVTSIGENVTLGKTNSGTWNIGSQLHGDNSTLQVRGANVVMNSDAGSPAAAPLAVEVGGPGVVGANVSFNATQHLRSLTITNPNIASVTAGGEKTLFTGALSMDTQGTLDMADNDLVVNAASFSDIQSLVLTGFGQTTGGITSSTSDGSQILALFDNALVGAGDWNGSAISANAVVGKYTYFGDANIDGQVTGDDYTVIDANLNTSPLAGVAWLSGDMNLDGDVTGDDYTVIDANLGLGSGNPLAASRLSSLSAVPEPAALSIAVIGLSLITRRTRRRVP